MTSRRKFLEAFGAFAAAAPLVSLAQQTSAAIRRIGFLSSSSDEDSVKEQEALRAGLRELGYAEGRNLVIELRWAKGNYDRLPELALELVRLKVHVIVSAGTSATLAAMKATATIPIVMASSGDPLRSGIVASLARPGGNITGLTILSAELAAKRLQLLKETLPGVSRVAFLLNSANASHPPYLKDLRAAASELRLTLQLVEARDARDFESVFAGMMQKRPDALMVTGDSVHRLRLAWIVDFAANRRLPAMYQLREYVAAGGLISYGASRNDQFRRAALFVDKILKGAKPGDLPVEQPTKFELVINLKSAKNLGITFPQSVLLRADEIIQ